MSQKSKPSFEKINKYNVAIASLKNLLKQATSVDELTILAGKIIELEQQIIIEKSTGYKQLEEQKKQIENRIDKIKRELRRAEDDLRYVDNSLDLRVNGYKKMLQSKMETLSEEYSNLVNQLEANKDAADE